MGFLFPLLPSSREYSSAADAAAAVGLKPPLNHKKINESRGKKTTLFSAEQGRRFGERLKGDETNRFKRRHENHQKYRTRQQWKKHVRIGKTLSRYLNLKLSPLSSHLNYKCNCKFLYTHSNK